MKIISGRAYDVFGSLPPGSEGNDKTWSTHERLLVIADSIDDALKIARAYRPSMKIDNIKHLGERAIVVDA